MEVLDVACDGETVVVEWRGTGAPQIFLGEFLGVVFQEFRLPFTSHVLWQRPTRDAN